MPKFSLRTTKPVAYDSPDHLQPHGTRWDNSRNLLFNKKVYALFPNRKLAFLDFGCSGGGFVKSCIEAGHDAVGLEGSDYSQRNKRAEWATIPDNLFTTDVTADWQLSADGAPARFDVVTAWEFIEHIRPEDLPKVAAAVHRHLAPGGLWVMSVSTDEEVINGHVLHQTVQGKDWWVKMFADNGLTHHEAFVQYFQQDWVRGPLQNAPGSFHLVLSRTTERPPAIPPGFQHALVDLLHSTSEFLQKGIQNSCPGMVEYALLSIDAALRQAPNHVEMHFARANVLLNLNRRELAADACRKVLQLHPGHANARMVLAQLTPAAPVAPARTTPGTFTLKPAAFAAPAPAPAPAAPATKSLVLKPATFPKRSSSTTSTPKKGPKISIVTPTFNCAKYIRQCIESVLAQGYDNFEHIIVDGASKDETVEILQQYPHVRWLSEPDEGEAEALNKALKMATGDVIGWLNADDYYVGTAVFKNVLRTLRDNPTADVVYGNCAIIDQNDTVVGLRVPRANLDLRQIMHWQDDLRLFQPSIFYTRRVNDAVGPYNEELYFSIDLEYWIRTAAAGFSWVHFDATFSASRLVRDGAKSAGSVRDQEESWVDVTLPHVHRLSPGQQFNYWKEFYRWRLLNQARQQVPLNAPEDPYALRGLCYALIQLKAHQPAIEVAEKLMTTHPTLPDGYLYAAEIFYAENRPTEAAHFSQLAFSRTGHTFPRPKLEATVHIKSAMPVAQPV